MYLGQIRAQLCVTERAWCDFVSFSPEVPKPARLMVIRYERTAADMLAIEQAVNGFNGEIDAAVEKLRGIVGPFELPAQVMDEPKADPDADLGRLTDADFVGLI